jgi:flagellar biosynthetic protein FliR
LLINLLMAILGRTVSQLNVFILSFPVTITVGFLVMGAALPFTVGIFEDEFGRMEGTLGRMMALLGRG